MTKGMCGIEVHLCGTLSGFRINVANNPGLRFAYPGLLDETPSGYKPDIAGGQVEGPQNDRIQGDVNAVLNVLSEDTGTPSISGLRCLKAPLMRGR